MTLTYTISIKDLASQHGLSACPKDKLEIIWDTPSCADIVCDYGNGVIEVQIPEGCEDKCFYGIVRCLEDCPTCDDQRIKICPCDPENPDCGPCEICDPVLGCITVCEPDEVCDPTSNKCVECDDENPCPGGKVCVNGKCECPPDKPYDNDGICLNCDLNDPSSWPPCTICTLDGLVPKECPIGVCDPATGECVECILDSHCEDPNAECKDGVCECKPGYVYDIVQDKCVPEPECTDNDDCTDPCQSCNHVTGKCEPIQCPAGQICVDGKCVDLCDCNDPESCGGNKACVPYGGGLCYCKNCSEENCTDGCGEGCVCNQTTFECEVSKCSGSCTNGTDCGKGCGCDPVTSQCVDCSSLDCRTTCGDVLGCYCPDDKNCREYPDGEDECTTGCECDAGHGCFEGKCQHCSNFSASEASTIPGCNSSQLTDDMSYVLDEDNCTLKVTQNISGGCACPAFTLNAGVLNSGYSAQTQSYSLVFNTEIRKGSGDESNYLNLPKLGDDTDPDIADNEEPSSGFVELTTKIYYKTYKETPSGSLVYVGIIGEEQSALGGSLSGTDTHVFPSVSIPAIGSGTDLKRVSRVEIVITKKGGLSAPNGCSYIEDQIIGSWSFNDNDSLDAVLTGAFTVQTGEITSSDTRPPLWKFYKSASGSYTEDSVFYKAYITQPGGGKHIADLLGPDKIPSIGSYPLAGKQGELWGNRNYLVKPDCGCTDSLDIGKVGFCNPDTFSYEAKDCNTKILLKAPFVPCSVNQDIKQWGYDIPTDVQAKYDLYLNDTFVARFVHDKGLGMIKEGTSKSMFDKYDLGGLAINSVRIDVVYGTYTHCSITEALEEQEDRVPVTEVDCATSGTTYGFILNKNADGGSLATISSFNVTPTASSVSQGDSWRLFLEKGTTYTIDIIWSDGCTSEISTNNNCCDAFDFSVQNNTNSCGGDLEFVLTSVSGVSPITYTIVNPAGVSSTFTGTTYTLSNYDPGTYNISAVDANGCVADAQNILITSSPEVTYTLSEDQTICTNETTNITLDVSATGVGGTVKYRINGGSVLTVVVPANGQVVFGPINNSITYLIMDLTVGECQIPINETVIVSTVDTPQVVNFTVEDTTICQGSSTNILLSTNSPGAIVQISGNDGSSYTITSESGGNTIPVNPTSDTVYLIESISTSQTCIGAGGQQISLMVTQGQSISITNEECSNDLTQKTYTFNFISSATDQDGDTLTIVNGNQIVVDLFGSNAVTQINAVYTDGACTSNASVAVQDCGCNLSVDIEVDGSPVLEGETVDITVGDTVVLEVVAITGGNGSNYNISWSTGATSFSISVSPLTDTIYTVSVFDPVLGCSVVRQISINVINCTAFQILGADIDFDVDNSITTGQCCYSFNSITVSDSANITLDDVNVNGTSYAFNYNGTTGVATLVNPLQICLANGETISYSVQATSIGSGGVTCVDNAIFNESSACVCITSVAGGNTITVNLDSNTNGVESIDLSEFFFTPQSIAACGGKLYGVLEGNEGTRVLLYDAEVSGNIGGIPGGDPFSIPANTFGSWAIYLGCSTGGPISRNLELRHECEGSGQTLCSTTIVFTIPQCPDECATNPLLVGGTTQPETCNAKATADGSVTMNLSGGTGPFTVTGALTTVGAVGGPTIVFPDLATGNYTGTVTDSNDCTANYDFTIADDNDCCQGMSVELGPDKAICPGDSVALNAAVTQATIGPAIATYTWSVVSGDTNSIDSGQGTASISVSPNSVTVYELEIDDGTCTETDQVTVNVSALSNTSTYSPISGLSLSSVGGIGTVTYEAVNTGAIFVVRSDKTTVAWSPSVASGAYTPVPLQNGDYLAGDYTIRATDSIGCVSEIQPGASTPLNGGFPTWNGQCFINNAQADVYDSPNSVATGGTGPYSYIYLTDAPDTLVATPIGAGGFPILGTITVGQDLGSFRVLILLSEDSVGNIKVGAVFCDAGS